MEAPRKCAHEFKLGEASPPDEEGVVRRAARCSKCGAESRIETLPMEFEEEDETQRVESLLSRHEDMWWGP